MKIGYEVLPHYEPVEGSSKKARLCEDWFFTIDDIRYWIPAGYVFDGASIPRIFWTVIGSPFQPNYWAAALAHDWLYLTHFTTREQADAVIYALLVRAGVGKIKARIIWASVRGFAMFAWDNKTEDLQEIQEIKHAMSERADHWKFGM